MRTCQQSSWVLTAERSLFREVRQECKGMHARFVFACPEFTLAPSRPRHLPNDCPPVLGLQTPVHSKVSFIWMGAAGSMEEQFQGKTANALARHVDLHFAVWGGVHPEPTAPKINVSKLKQLFFFLPGL